MADWWSPLISAAAGLTGVWVIGRTTRLVPEHLALNVPQVEAGDVELDAGAVGAGALAQPLHQHLRFCHNLAAAVARLPAARTAEEAKGGIVEHLAAARDSTRQIHPGLGDRRRLPDGRGAGNRVLQAPMIAGIRAARAPAAPARAEGPRRATARGHSGRRDRAR
jgi:hypothetical protein